MNNDQDPNVGGAPPAANPENPPAEPNPPHEEEMDVEEEGDGNADPPPLIHYPIESYTTSAPAPTVYGTNDTLMDPEPFEGDDQEDPNNQASEEDVHDPPPGLVYQEDPGYGDDSDYEDQNENGFYDGLQQMTEPVENSPYLYRYPQQSYNLRLRQRQPLVLRFHPNGIVPWIALLPLAWASTVQVEPAGP